MRGNVDAKIIGNTVTGNGPVDYIAQNGIVVLRRPRRVAQIWGNKVSGNFYTAPADTCATGILVIDAKVSIDQEEHAVRQRGRHPQRLARIVGKSGQRLATTAAGSQHQPLTVRQDN